MLLQRLDKVLSRLGDLASACFELLFGISAGLASSTDARFRLRSGQTKLATVRSALRPFARQDHLIGAEPGPSSARRIARSPERVSARSSPASMIGHGPESGVVKRRNGSPVLAHRVVLLRCNDPSAIGGTADSRKPPARPHL